MVGDELRLSFTGIVPWIKELISWVLQAVDRSVLKRFPDNLPVSDKMRKYRFGRGQPVWNEALPGCWILRELLLDVAVTNGYRLVGSDQYGIERPAFMSGQEIPELQMRKTFGKSL